MEDVSTYSTTAKNFIYAYNTLSSQKTKLVEGSFLNFSTNKPIIGVNILENLLFWTDNRNQPRKINIQSALDGSVSYNTEDKISVAKYNPYQSIELIKPSEQSGAVVETKTTSSAVSNSNVIPLNNVTNLLNGLGVTGTGVETNTFVTEISGSNVKVNKNQTIANNVNLNFVRPETTMYDASSPSLQPVATAKTSAAIGGTVTTSVTITGLVGAITPGSSVTGNNIKFTTPVNRLPFVVGDTLKTASGSTITSLGVDISSLVDRKTIECTSAPTVNAGDHVLVEHSASVDGDPMRDVFLKIKMESSDTSPFEVHALSVSYDRSMLHNDRVN